MAVGAVDVALSEEADVEGATQDEGVEGAGTTQEQALEMAEGIEEHWLTNVGSPVVAVLVAAV